MPLAAEAYLHTLVDQAFAMQPRGDAGMIEHIDTALLQHASANATQHVVRAASFDDDSVDAIPEQELPEQQSRRAGTDDGDLSARARHYRLRT